MCEQEVQETIAWLNEHIRYQAREVIHWEVCDSCPENECECCGQEIECDYYGYEVECPRIRDAIENAGETSRGFKMGEVYGIKMLIDHPRVVGVPFPPRPIEDIKEVYRGHSSEEGVYFETEKECLLNQGESYLIKSDGQVTGYNTHLVDSILKIAKDPKIHHASNKPLIIEGVQYTFLLAPRCYEVEG